MAYIQFNTSEVEFLHTLHIFGRKSRSANTSLRSHLVSRKHASIEWNGSIWQIQDFSRNGTWINNKRVGSHQTIKLKVGYIVKLGSDDGNGITFEVLNLDPPQNVIYRPYPSLQAVPINDSNLIPEPMSPDFGFYYCYGRKGWFSQVFTADNSSTDNCEKGPYAHGEEIICAGNRWTVFLLNQDHASIPIEKAPKTKIDDIEFQISFNRNSSDVRINLISKDDEIELESQIYTKMIAKLITLQQESRDGWVLFQQLCKATGKDQANINLQLFMLRHHLATKLDHCAGVSKVIERNTNSLRLGIQNFSIYRDGKLDQSSDYEM